MNTEIKALCVLVICCLSSLLVYVVNLKRKNRKNQLIVPFVAGVYSILATILLLVYKYDLIVFINRLGLEGNETIQQVNYIYSVDNLVNTDIALFNLSILVSYFIIKILFLLFIKVFSKKSVEDGEETKVYYYDKDDSVWLLKDEWVNFRSLTKCLAVGVIIVFTLFLTLTCYFGHDHSLWLYIFFVIPMVVVVEIANYFNGYTKEEFHHSIYGMDAYAQRINNYHKLRELYEKLFPNELLVSTTSNEHTNRESGNEIVDDLKKSNKSIERITGEFFENNDKNHYEVDNLIASVNLTKGKNVVFFNPFYRDLSDYIALPLINTLLSSNKCLVISGRNSISDDIKSWLKSIIKEYTKMKSLWRISTLSHKEPDCEIGILNSSSLYDLSVLKANKNFFSEVKFIIFVEPSLIINTAQISLSIIAQIIRENGDDANFCVFDKQTDGMVDTLSHVMKQEIVNVVAPPIPEGAYTAMAWNADGDYLRQNLFDKQTKYLGNGIELAAVAIKNQIPKVTWFSESKAPVRDIKWIAAQYYPTLCKYMNLPSQQKSIHDRIRFESSLWSAPREKDSFIIVEDEFNNLFVTLRAFLTRGLSQSFVNVFSENYLLRDYMRCNTRMFLSNPNSIPSLVPDYAKTERNIIIKLLLMMSINEVEEKEIENQFQLANIQSDNILRTLYSLITKYTEADEQILKIRSTDSDIGEIDANTYYSISKESFEEYFANSLKTAYYIVESEKDEEEYLDSKLYGHVIQSLLPDQFITYDGKYYKVKYISTDNGVILRRSSDLYNENQYYRQIRHYNIDTINAIVAEKTVIDIEFSILQCDFEVNTTGYLQLSSNNDLRNAQVVKFGLDTDIDKFRRVYKNKNILKIKLPDTDDRIRFTLSMLLSELFKTVYPTSWQYIAVLSAIPDDVDGMLNYMIYSSNMGIEDDYIYIIEDSYMDLGLLNSIEKNIFKFFEVIADFLDWHEEKMREPERKDPVPKGLNSISEEKEEQKHSLFSKMAKRIRDLFVREKEANEAESNIDVQVLKPQETSDVNDKAEKSTSATPSDTGYSFDQETANSDNNAEKSTEGTPSDIGYSFDQETADTDDLKAIKDEALSSTYSLDDDTNRTEVVEEKQTEQTEALTDQFAEDDYIPTDGNAELSSIDGTDIFDNEGTPDDYLLEIQFKELGIIPLKKTRYQKECYLKFGFDEIDGRLKIDELKRYLRVHGWSNNNLTKARKRDVLTKQFIDFNAENHCDFCGIPLSGVSFDRLNDGRIRCTDCSANTISTVDEVEKLFHQVLDMMENFFGVNYKVPISLEMTDAKTVAKKAGMLFKPTTEFAERVLGFAKLYKGRYSLVLENGSPKLAAIDTMVHEMTHIWQYINWNDSQVSSIYQMPNKDCPEKSACDNLASLIVYEGMAVWASIQYLYQMGEIYYASQHEAYAESRQDVYGIGFRLYKEKYPIIKDGSIIKYTPFLEFPTIEPNDVLDVIKEHCINKEHNC